MATNAVDLENLHKTFDGGENFVLKGIDLHIPKGQLAVMIGYSGTGKSVLLKHILGLIKPTEGVVKVFGQDVNAMEHRDLIRFRTRLGVLFQHVALFDDMTALENACFPLREHRPDLAAEEVIDIGVEKLQNAGFDRQHYGKVPSELSSGMLKRVGLARALALDPEILLYDEPTTGLDPILTEMVDNLILDTHRQQKDSTSIVVTHDLAAAFKIGDYIVMLDKGRVLLSGKPEDFLNSDEELVRRFIEKGYKKA